LQESSAFRDIPVVIMSSENVPARISRCLEEGAEEFFLKPVRLADLNKLKPHMMKTKLKNQKLEEIETTSKVENGVPTAVADPEIKDSTNIEIEILPLQQDLLLVQQEEQTLSINNKRKSVEEGISTDRARPRFDGIATAV
jgi:two-component response regulator (ARR-A family)